MPVKPAERHQSVKSGVRSRSAGSFFAAQRRLAATLVSLGSCAGPCVCARVCLIWTHPARSDGRDATSWRPARPGTQRRRRPSAPPAGSAGDAPRSRGRRSRCSEGSLQSQHRQGHNTAGCSRVSRAIRDAHSSLGACLKTDEGL